MTIEQRLERLERQIKRLSEAVGELNALAALTVGATSGPRDVEFGTIKAKGIFVVQENGKPGVYLGADPVLGGVMSTLSPAGKVLVNIVATDEGNGAISTKSKTGMILVGITADDEGNGAISTNSKTGKPLVGIIADDEGNGSIYTYDSGEKELIRIGGSRKDTGEGMIAAFNRAGNVRAVWPLP